MAEVPLAAMAGAAFGLTAGPPGFIAGALLGSAAGAMLSIALDQNEHERVEHDKELDDAIGVTSGSIGAPNLEHPPAVLGAYSMASSGAQAYSDATPAEGPIQEVD